MAEAHAYYVTVTVTHAEKKHTESFTYSAKKGDVRSCAHRAARQCLMALDTRLCDDPEYREG